MKNTLERIKNSSDDTDKWINKQKVRIVAIIQLKDQKEKKIKKRKTSEETSGTTYKKLKSAS